MRCPGHALFRLWAQRSQYTHCLGVHNDLQLKTLLSPSVKILVESQKPLLIWPNWASKWENIYINTSDLSESPPVPSTFLSRTNLSLSTGASLFVQKLLSLIRSCLFVFALGDWPKKCIQFLSENILPIFTSGSFMMSYLILKFSSHFEFIFCVWYEGVF